MDRAAADLEFCEQREYALARLPVDTVIDRMFRHDHPEHGCMTTHLSVRRWQDGLTFCCYWRSDEERGDVLRGLFNYVAETPLGGPRKDMGQFPLRTICYRTLPPENA